MLSTSFCPDCVFILPVIFNVRDVSSLYPCKRHHFVYGADDDAVDGKYENFK